MMTVFSFFTVSHRGSISHTSGSFSLLLIIGIAIVAVVLSITVVLYLLRKKNKVFTQQTADQIIESNDHANDISVVQKAAAQINQFESTHRKKGPKKQLHIKLSHILAVAVASLLIGIGIICYLYISQYHNALQLAKNGSFSEAQNNLFLPFIAKLHDPQFSDYLQAGKLLEDGQYDEAEKSFAQLGDYLNAPEMLMETDYRKGNDYLESGNYYDAFMVFSQLNEKNYSDSCKMAEASLFNWAAEFLEQNDWINAYTVMTMGADLPTISSELLNLEDTIYNTAVSLYRSGDDDQQFMAYLMFYKIYPYKQSENYLILLKAKSPMYRWEEGIWNIGALRSLCEKHSVEIVNDVEEPFIPETSKVILMRREEIDSLPYDCTTVMDLIGFENTTEVIVNSAELEYEFLIGTWKSDIHGKTFVMQDVSPLKVSINSSSTDWEMYRFIVDDKSNNSEPADMYSFKIIDKNTIDATFWATDEWLDNDIILTRVTS